MYSNLHHKSRGTPALRARLDSSLCEQEGRLRPTGFLSRLCSRFMKRAEIHVAGLGPEVPQRLAPGRAVTMTQTCWARELGSRRSRPQRCGCCGMYHATLDVALSGWHVECSGVTVGQSRCGTGTGILGERLEKSASP